MKRLLCVILLLAVMAVPPASAAPAAAPEAPAANAVRISQVYGGGGNSGATYKNDFIELFNSGSSAVSLAGWSVQYASAAGTTWAITNLTGSITAGGYYLVQEAAGTGGTVDLPTPDASGSLAMSGSNGKVALASNQTAITGKTDSDVVDFVGYGTANEYEGSGATPALTNTTAALRAGNGCTDTDSNAADFTTGAPNPRNSSSATNSCVVVDTRPTATSPLAGATDVAVNTDITVNFSESVDVATGAFTVACPTGTPVAFTPNPVLPATGTSSVVLNPDSDLPQKTTCTVTVAANKVTDKDGTPEAMAADYVFSFTTYNPDVCSTTFTPIYSIQGSGDTAAITGAVTTQGVVVGDFEGPSPALRGFYLQAVTGDSDAATSDGIFVFHGDSDTVSVGDVVRVTGSAAEYQGQTQISSVSALVACGTGAVTPVDVTLPVASATALEPYEGMLVRFPQTLYVTEHFQLGRFGQIFMSSGGRLKQPTNVTTPGTLALNMQAANDLNRIIVDDDTNAENPAAIKFGRGGNPLSAANTLRGADTATGLVGVLTYTWSGNSISGNAYRLRPINALGGGSPVFTAANPRPGAPGVAGQLRVTASNTLNYFNSFTNCTLGVGGASATANCRGADNQTEFDRQWPKTVANLVGGGADVIGLMEIENDGYGSTSAIQDLVNRLNAATAAGTYAFINPDTTAGVNSLGTDAIKVALIYKPAKVAPVGTTAALNTVAFVNGGDSAARNRPALAQAFEEVATGERFIAVVNHLKSKGSACTAPDAGDGQGNCNVVRTNAANALTAWLAGSNPTGTGDPDILIMGDLNAYAKEDPITAIKGAGYVNLIEDRLGADAYSYAFDGQWGYLDHALASNALNPQVVGVEEWHINADEPSVLDYNTDFKTVDQISGLYAADRFRASDHDPVIIGLDLAITNDLGSLPALYGAAWHSGNGAVRLGSAWAAGAGAGTNDGVVRTPGVNWQVGVGGGSIDVTVTGATGYFSAWIDWNADNDFADTGEFVINNRMLAAGTQPLTFDIPTGVTFKNTFNARFRLYASSQTGGTLMAAGFGPDAAPSPTGGAAGGEVEDYTWDFGPNAVGLRSLTAAPVALPAWPLGAGLAALAGLALRRRRR